MILSTKAGNPELPFKIIKRVNSKNMDALMNFLHRDSKRKKPRIANKIFKNYMN